MIRNLQSGPGIRISESALTWPSWYGQPGYMNVGQVRYNGSNQALEVFDGNYWMAIHAQHPVVQLDEKTLEILDWAKQKMKEETRLKELMKKHPGLKDAHEKFEILKTLCSE